MKNKISKKQIIAIIISVIVILFLTANVYAGINGYGNLFFMIKELTKENEVSTKAELLVDEEIQISYTPIKITDQLSMQVNRMVIEDDNATLYFTFESENQQELDLEVTKLSAENKEATENVATKKINIDEGTSKEEIKLDYKVLNTDNFKIRVSNKDKELKILTLNLATKEIVVEGEGEVAKQSEVELRRYLEAFLISADTERTDFESALEIAYKIKNLNDLPENLEINNFDAKEATNIMLDSWGITELSTMKNNKNEEIIKAEGNLYDYNIKNNQYKSNVSHTEGIGNTVIEIKDISYSNKIYTVKFTYAKYFYNGSTGSKEYDETLYERTVKVKLNDDQTFSKYKLLNLGECNNAGTNSIKADVTLDKKEETDGFTNSGYTAKSQYKAGNANENGVIALEKAGFGELTTEKNDGYVTYIDGWNNKYYIKNIIFTTSEYICTSKKVDGTNLYCVKINYISKDDSYRTLELAVTVEKNGYVRIEGNFDSYTGSTPFVKNFTDFYADSECEHEYKVEAKESGHIEIDGTHKCVCELCGSEIEEPHHFTEWYDIGDAWTLWCTDCKHYVYTRDYDVVFSSGYPVKENCEHKYKAEAKESGHIEIDGTHKCVCELCGSEIEEPHHFTEWYDIGDAWTLWCTDCKHYVYTRDYEVVFLSGYPVKNTEGFGDFESWVKTFYNNEDKCIIHELDNGEEFGFDLILKKDEGFLGYYGEAKLSGQDNSASFTVKNYPYEDEAFSGNIIFDTTSKAVTVVVTSSNIKEIPVGFTQDFQ